MARIQQLDSHVADLIAAGEVVERPASVVKELVENAIDAGSTAIVVEIRRGGMGDIRVTDNGCGISPEDLPTAFLRHATSKLRSADDLGKIGTLGFRGEALAAISSVSRVEILTRQTGAETGSMLRLEGGNPGQVEEAGAPEGTTIHVRDLFYNTPARLKFMRKDSAETAAVAGLIQHLALSHPNISFKFIKDGTESLHTPGDGRLDSTIYAALGREFAKTLIPVEGSGGEIQVKGFITAPLNGRGSRTMQVFFVNGRFIKSQLLTAALEEGYRNQIMKGKFPGCVLSVTLPVTAVDVNVHPAKTQVKFAREREVFDALYHTVLDCLAERDRPVRPQQPVSPVPRQQDFFQTMDAKTFREQTRSAQPVQAAPVRPAAQAPTVHAAPVRPAAPAKEEPAAPVRSGWDTERNRTARVMDREEKQVDYQVPPAPEKPKLRPFVPSAISAAPPSVTAKPSTGQVENVETAPVETGKPAEIPAAETQTVEKPAIPEPPKPAIPAIPAEQQGLELPEQTTIVPQREAPWRIAGEVLHTYIVCESEEGVVWLIDKHAAHERVNFDRMMAAQEPPMRQTLLKPIVAEPEREAAQLLLENLPLLEQFGFLCEDFGDGAILVREVPADLDAEDTVETLEEFAENLRTGRSLSEKRENLLHTMACKASIKGGWTSDPAELRVLVDKVQSGAIKYCPHGRPVAVKLTRYELEKMFKRA